MEYLLTMLKDYNGFLSNTFDNNQMLTAAVTTVVIGMLLGFLYKIPILINKLLNKYLITTITVDSSTEAYHNLIDNLLTNSTMLENSISYTIHTGRFGWGKTRLGVGTGTQLVVMKSRLCMLYITRDKMMDSFSYTMYLTTFKYGSYEFAKWLHGLASVTSGVKDTYTIKQRTKDGITTQHQKIAKFDSLVLTDPATEVIKLMELFISSEETYVKYNISYKLGLLLDGVPGSGKTSIVRHIASRYGYNIAVIKSISDLEALSAQSVDEDRNLLLLIEEIDMLLSTNRDDASGSKKDGSLATLVNNGELAKALSILDGVVETPGRIVIATTNKASSLDAALKRPGRFDHTITFDYLKPKEFGLFTKLYYDETIIPKEINQCTPVSLQQDFVSLTKDEFISKNVKVV